MEDATEMNFSSDLTTELTGLEPNTIYQVRIQSDCGTSQSAWRTVTFKTECVAFEEFPYTQGFEGTVDCWTAEQISGSNGWGVTSYNYHNGERCVSMPYTPGAVSRLISPLFDISSLTNSYLTFFYHIEDYLGTTDYFDVYYRTEDSEDWTQLGSTYNTVTEDFEYVALALPEGTIQISFLGHGNDGNNIFIDDVTIENISCEAPTAVTLSEITGHTVEVAWEGDADVISYQAEDAEEWESVTVSESPYTLEGLDGLTTYSLRVGYTCEDQTISFAPIVTFETDVTCPAPVVTISNITETSVTISYTGDAEEYELKYKTLSDEDWTTETITENPYTLENLSPSTTYTVELRANCGEEDSMSLAGTTSFSTACVTITDFPYTESFESNSLGCWLSNPVDAIAPNWSTREHYNSSTAPADGSYYVDLYLNNNDAYHHAQLLSPTFDLSSIGNPTLTFSHIQKAWSPDQDTLGLYYRTSTEGEWTYLTSWSSNINTWQNETITLPEPSAEYQLMFLGATHYGYGVGIDNITIDGDGETPEPVQPTVVTNAATSVTQTSAVLNGEITSLGNQTITARGFEWKLATATDYTTFSATGTTMSATLTGLTANTTYKYRAFAMTALGTVYGSELTFTTLEQGDEPCTPTSSTTEITICAGETYEFNGQTYNATGTYTATLTNAAGCDSVATLNLTVRPENAPIEETVTLNNDELPYTWRGEQYTEFGTYTVAGEDENGCPQEYTLTLVHNSSIAEVENEYSIALYPNPTSENATLSVKGLNEEATVIVTDQAGRVISTTRLALGQETMEVETSKLASGVYYIRIQTANSVRTEKLIKNN